MCKNGFLDLRPGQGEDGFIGRAAYGIILVEAKVNTDKIVGRGKSAGFVNQELDVGNSCHRVTFSDGVDEGYTYERHTAKRGFILGITPGLCLTALSHLSADPRFVLGIEGSVGRL